MATNVNKNTFLSTYNDDFKDSDHYHRILFNNGRALQARELTQSQTIIQGELAKLAGFIFKEGGIFDTSMGNLSAGVDAVSFVKVDSLPTGYAELKGKTINNDAGVKAVVKAVIHESNDDDDFNVLLVKYTTSNSLTSTNTAAGPRIFLPGETLNFTLDSQSQTVTVQTTNTNANPATGKGSMIEVPQFNTFVAGHLIMVEKQTLVIDKFNPTPTIKVGYKLTQEVFTTADDIALYDNSGSTPNLTSPGADRLKITMTLIREDDIAAGDTFYPVFDIIRGRIRTLQTQDNLLSQLGSILNTRTNSITGDFIVRKQQFGEMGLKIEKDSDNDYLLYKVDGGVAFVKGNRVEKSSPETIRIKKSRENPGDIEEKNNEFISARYGNYFLADSMYGIVNDVKNLESLNLYSSEDRGGTNIGSARVRNVDEYGGQYRIYLFDVKMDSSGGTPYSVANVRSIGTNSASYANLIAKDDRFDIYDKQYSTLLFELPKTRVQEVSNVTMAVRKIIQDTATGTGTASFSATGSNTFANTEDWLVANDDDNGTIYDNMSISLTTNDTVANITGLTGVTSGDTLNLLAYENITATRKEKTLVEDREQSGLSVTNGRFELDKADIYKFKSVTDDTTSEDITYKFIFDNGQRDEYYKVGGGRLRKGHSAPSGTITVTYDYFTHSNGDYFAGARSYPQIEYQNIPVYTTSRGKKYRLSDVIDMRPVKSASNDFTSAGSVKEDIPNNGDTITVGTVKYWQGRMDVVALDIDGKYTVYQSKSAAVPTKPQNIPSTSMELHHVSLKPYTVDHNDLSVNTIDHRGYKMKDIAKLEKRVSNVERGIALNAVEIATLKQVVADPNDNTLPDRVKQGITVDAFINNRQSMVEDLDYRARINTKPGTLTPISYVRDIRLKFDSDESYALGTVQRGNSIWPKYTEEVMISQTRASRSIDINQFEIQRTIGSGFIEPNIDTWSSRKLVDESYQPEATESFIDQGTYSVSSQSNN